ncbi:glutaredoxin 3 [Elongatibacter sediminis]|uniref:Glutaredoxin n=1 Tax=Elongatibacter sediminis TaxID=3119006 RepID=A0AAW9R6M7_9GAMM
MRRLEIYFKSWCPYCNRALNLLDSKGVAYDAIDVTHDMGRELEMRRRSGRTSVPQIFAGDRHLGGFDDIAQLDRHGELDPILSQVTRDAA